jgi:hypothetical protein
VWTVGRQSLIKTKPQKPTTRKNTKMNPQIEINPEQKINDPVMADCGTQYFSTFQYRVDGDIMPEAAAKEVAALLP